MLDFNKLLNGEGDMVGLGKGYDFRDGGAGEGVVFLG